MRSRAWICDFSSTQNTIIKIGPELVFGRLWQDMGIGELISELAAERRYGFDLERAVYLTVLHRLFASGTKRARRCGTWLFGFS